EQGMPLATTYYSPHQYRSSFASGSSDGASCQVNGEWRYCPTNSSESMQGLRTMWSGFGMSVNTYFVQLIEDTTPGAAVEMAERLGLRWHNPNDQNQADNPDGWGSFTLGTSITTPLEMANAYATIAS